MKQIIGRKDKADFPKLELRNIDVKIDTGAYGSSIHCHHIQERIIDGKKAIQFKLLDPSHPKYNDKTFVVADYQVKEVKNSFGQSERRYVFSTTIRLFGEDIQSDFSLSERGEMKFPVLLGRKLLIGRFIVDPAMYNLSFREKKLHHKAPSKPSHPKNS